LALLSRAARHNLVVLIPLIAALVAGVAENVTPQGWRSSVAAGGAHQTTFAPLQAERLTLFRSVTAGPNGRAIRIRGNQAAPRIAVFAGYYDTHHPSLPQPKPDPWEGSPNVTFVGRPDSESGGWDSSAVRVDNLTQGALRRVTVTVDIGSDSYALWGRRTIPSGASLILTQMGLETFDGSDTNPAGCYGCDPELCITAVSDTIPVIHLRIGGRIASYFDTGQILNTHGVDSAGCPYTGTRNDESEDWQAVSASLLPTI
jgi:hypothetical protein